MTKLPSNVVFVLPGIHTNLHGAFDALSTNGVRLHVISNIERRHIFSPVFNEKIVNQDAIQYAELYNWVYNIDPDLVIIRKTGRLSRLMYWASVIQRRRVVGYDLRPYLRPRHIGQVLPGALKGRPMRRFTPVHGLAESGPPDPRAVYLPFPVEAMPDGGTRDYAPGRTTRILCVAKLTERRKNHFLLLQALESLARRFSFHVTLVGSSLNIQNPDRDYFNDLQNYAMHGPLAGRVTIKPDVPFSDMPAIYRSHDICVLPSRKEPLGIAPLEAMAQGCAAIVSSDAGSAYYVESGEDAGLPCGAVFPSGNEEALRGVLAGIMAEPDRLRTLGRNAAQWTRREFGMTNFVERFLHVTDIFG